MGEVPHGDGLRAAHVRAQPCQATAGVELGGWAVAQRQVGEQGERVGGRLVVEGEQPHRPVVVRGWRAASFPAPGRTCGGCRCGPGLRRGWVPAGRCRERRGWDHPRGCGDGPIEIGGVEGARSTTVLSYSRAGPRFHWAGQGADAQPRGRSEHRHDCRQDSAVGVQPARPPGGRGDALRRSTRPDTHRPGGRPAVQGASRRIRSVGRRGAACCETPPASAGERPLHWPLSSPQVFQHDRVQRGVGERPLFPHLAVAP